MRTAALLLFAVASTAAQSPLYKFPAAGTEPPVLISKVEAEYTPQARKAGLEGSVLLFAEIGVDGRAHRIHVTRRLGLGLDAKAIEAARKFRFRPGTRNGIPTRSPATIEVHFQLSNSSGAAVRM